MPAGLPSLLGPIWDVLETLQNDWEAVKKMMQKEKELIDRLENMYNGELGCLRARSDSVAPIDYVNTYLLIHHKRVETENAIHGAYEQRLPLTLELFSRTFQQLVEKSTLVKDKLELLIRRWNGTEFQALPQFREIREIVNNSVNACVTDGKLQHMNLEEASSAVAEGRQKLDEIEDTLP